MDRLDLDAMDAGVFMERGSEGCWWEVTEGGEVTPLCAFDAQERAPTCIRRLREDTFAALYRDGRIAIFARDEDRVEVLGCWRLLVTPGGVAGTSYFAELAIASSSLLLVSEHHELPDGAHGALFEAGVVRALLYHEADLLEVGHIAPDLTVARHDAAPSVSSACVGPFEGAFHGRSSAGIAAAGSEKMIKGFGPILPGFVHLPWADLDAVRAALGDTTAAVLIEPVQGEGGIRTLPDSCLKDLRALCDETGTLLILDEVFAGLDLPTSRSLRHILNGLGMARIEANHDLAALAGCDRVLRIAGGTVGDDGAADPVIARYMSEMEALPLAPGAL